MREQETLNGNLNVRVSVVTASMPWSPSPSPTVWRKRFHRVGPAESGQVTSVVRYDAGSDFPAHEHPDGEEILVLDGTFTDDRGDWPAGTFLLNPEGYSHAPSSRDGCVLFVKLRQYPGLDRAQVAIDTHALNWQPGDLPGIEVKPLYAQAGFTDTVVLERWQPGFSAVKRRYPAGAEIFVLRGEFADETSRFAAETWLRFPVGATHSPETEAGCLLYFRTGGFEYLHSE